jgi:hypothetical protein
MPTEPVRGLKAYETSPAKTKPRARLSSLRETGWFLVLSNVNVFRAPRILEQPGLEFPAAVIVYD